MSWATLPFPEVFADKTSGNVKTLQSDYLESGQYPIVDQGQQIVGGYTNDEERLCSVDGPVIVFGDHTKAFKYIDFPFCIGADGTKILKPKIDADMRYLFHAARQIHIPDNGYSRHFKYLKRGEIPLPPLEEQRRIAGILDQADALRRLRTRALDKLNTLGPAIFHEMFGNSFNIAQTSGQLTIGDVCSVSSGSTPSRKRPEFYDGDIPWVKTTEVNGRVILATEEKVTEEAVSAARLKTYPQDTVLVAMYGQGKTRGQVGILGLPATTNQACAAIQCGDALLHSFLFYQLKMSYSRLRALGQGGNQPNLNAGLVKGFTILVPPLSEQELFVQRVDEIEAVSNKVRSGLNTDNRLFASLQHRAFRGEL